MRSWRVRALGIAFALAFSADAGAETFPERPITIVVPYAAGGGTDLIARALGASLSARLHQAVVIDNRPGAGTIIGATLVARAKPDGHTLLMATSTTMAINPGLHHDLSYDPVGDFEPLALICAVPLVLVTNPQVPARTVPELVALAKAGPEQLTFASAGPGSPHHLFAELFKTMTGTEMRHVPYKGSAPALNDVVGGHVPLMFADLPAALPLIRAGQLRALGLSSSVRVAAAPEIAPIAEPGVPGFDASAWQMVVAPAATPAVVVARLRTELDGVAASDAVRRQLLSLGLVPLDNRPSDALKRFVGDEVERWAAVIDQAGITAED